MRASSGMIGVLGLLLSVAGCMGKPTPEDPLYDAPQTLVVESPAFPSGETIPVAYTCRSHDQHPPLAFAEVPTDAAMIALIMDDLDAPDGPFTHWSFWNLPTNKTSLEIDEDVKPYGATEGMNDFGHAGYEGPCFDEQGTHRYFFRAFAVDRRLELPEGAAAQALRDALVGHVLSWGEFWGTVTR